jgi:ribosomal protein S18 acetylase RimI-like enzyme
MTDTFRVRPAAGAGDLAACAGIYAANQREIIPDGPPQVWSPDGFGDAVMGEDVFVALASGGEVVGFLSLWRPDPFVHFLHVASDWRRRGVGRALLAHALATLPAGPVDLKCLPDNRAALAFYRRLGWVEVGSDLDERPPYVRLRLTRP